MDTMFIVTYTHGAYSERTNGNVCIFNNKEQVNSFVENLNAVVLDIQQKFPNFQRQWEVEHPAPAEPPRDNTGNGKYWKRPEHKNYFAKKAELATAFQHDKSSWVADRIGAICQVNLEDFPEIKTWIEHNWYDLEFSIEELKVL